MVIELLELLGIIGIVLSLAFIIANVVSNHRLPVFVLFIFLVASGSLAIYIFKEDLFNKYLSFIPKPQETLLIACGVSLFFSFLEFTVITHNTNVRRKLIKQGAFFEDSRILAYSTRRHNLFHYSKRIDEIIHGLKERDNQFKISKIFINNEEINLKHILKKIARCNNTINEPVTYKVRYHNGLEVDFDILKKPVTSSLKSQRVIGYVLIDNSISKSVKIEIEKDYKRNLFIYLDLLNQPIAYYDKDEKGYVLTNVLSKLLGVDNRVITSDNLKKIMHPEDIAEFENQRIYEGKTNQRFYRLKSGNSYFWFEEAVVNYFGKDFIILKKTDSSFTLDLNFAGYKDMVKDIQSLYDKNLAFGLAIINMKSLIEITNAMGADYADIIVNKYFTTIRHGNLKDQIKIFKIGTIEYALIIQGQEYVDLLIRSLDNNMSELLNQDIYISRKRNHIECQLGLVESRDVNSKDPRVIIKNAFDTIKEATDENFTNNFSVYQPVEIVEKEYDLKNLGIDLDINLDEFTNILSDK